MKIRLDRRGTQSLLEQARDQIISGLHAGLLRHGDRLPSLRQVAILSGLNVKTVMRTYSQLQREGLLVLRRGSGAFVTVRYPEEFEPSQAAKLRRLIHRHLEDASRIGVSQRAYPVMIQNYITRRHLKDRSVGVLECNEEQVVLFAMEIRSRIGVAARPILLADLGGRAADAVVRSCAILAVTDFHFTQGTEIARRFGRPLARLQLRRDFVPALMGAARQGSLVMIVSETSFVPAFKRALGLLGLQRDHLDRIRAVDGHDRSAVRKSVASADFVYISPLCERAARLLIPRGKRLLSFSHHISDGSIEELESWLLLSTVMIPARPPAS